MRNAISGVWGVLVAATITSWWLGTDHGVSDDDLAAVLILLVAFIKVRLVGLYFMELRHAPIPLRVVFEVWCVVMGVTLVVMFLVL